MADQDRTFSTSTVEANRAAQQGLGVGQRELDAERDPGEDLTTASGVDQETAPPAAEDDDWSETEADEDDGVADEDRRTLKAEAERGQGAKTRQHQKDAVSRRV